MDETPFPVRDTTTATDTPAPSWALPRTSFVWLALIVIAVLAPYVLRFVTGPDGESAKPVALSSEQFESLVSAEQHARSAFAADARRRNPLPSAFGDSGDKAAIVSSITVQRDRDALEAIREYRKVIKRGDAVNSARKIILLGHLLGKPFDYAFVQVTLEPALQSRKTPRPDIEKELRLWRTILASNERVSSTETAGYEQLIRKMELRQFENCALADLYTAAGDMIAATRYQTALDRTATWQNARASLVGVFYIAEFLGGLVALVFFVRFLIKQQWHDIRAPDAVGEVKPAARLLYADLLDAALFYIASLQVLRLVFVLLSPLVFVARTATALVLSGTGVYIGSALVAVVYTAAVLKRRGATWADLGMRTRGIGGVLREVGYGIVGYGAMMPFILLLGLLARLITQNSSQLTPNPILPLLVAEHDVWGRVLIFLLVAVAAPLLEELFFRGVLYTGLRKRYGWAVSALLSGVLFAVLHPIADWLPIVGLGFCFAIMREHRQSLVPSMTAHFLQNSLAFVGILLSGQ